MYYLIKISWITICFQKFGILEKILHFKFYQKISPKSILIKVLPVFIIIKTKSWSYEIFRDSYFHIFNHQEFFFRNQRKTLKLFEKELVNFHQLYQNSENGVNFAEVVDIHFPLCRPVIRLPCGLCSSQPASHERLDNTWRCYKKEGANIRQPQLLLF